MKCNVCGSEFLSIRALCGHKAHCGSEKLECHICGRYISRYSLSKHIKAHEHDRPCKNCGKTVFGNKSFCNQSCSASYNNSHGGRRKHPIVGVCEICGKEERRWFSKRFCSRKCAAEAKKRDAVHRMMEGQHITPGVVRRIILSTRDHKCVICNNDIWNGVEIPLVVDHINGNPYDDRPDNLRLICPNCDAQTPTYMIKNKGNGRSERRKRYKQGKSY